MTAAALGRVVGLWRYPVKSMAAHALDEVSVSWHGLAGDRRWAFVRPDHERSGFPWHTIRQQQSLWGYQPDFLEPDRLDASATVVRTPSGHVFDVADPGGAVLGSVTSGTFSPSLRTGIGLALLTTGVEIGDDVTVDVRGRPARMTVVDPPFVDASPR